MLTGRIRSFSKLRAPTHPRLTVLLAVFVAITALLAVADAMASPGAQTAPGLGSARDLGVSPDAPDTGLPPGSGATGAAHASVSVMEAPTATAVALGAARLPDTGGAPLESGSFWWILLLVASVVGGVRVGWLLQTVAPGHMTEGGTQQRH